MLVLCSTQIAAGGRLTTVPGANLRRTTTTMAAQTAENLLKTAVKVQFRPTPLMTSAVSEAVPSLQPLA